MQNQIPKKKKRRNFNKVNRIMVLTGIEDIEEIQRLIAKENRRKKLEKIKSKRSAISNKKDLSLSQPKKQESQEITLDSDIVLPFVKLLIDKNLITIDELKSLTLKEDNPLRHFSYNINNNKTLSKDQCRQYWLYLMRNNQLFCEICGHPITKETNKGLWKLTADHRIPRSKGGLSDSTNLGPSHSICNNIKADILPEDWEKLGLELLKKYNITVDHNNSIYKYIKELQR